MSRVLTQSVIMQIQMPEKAYQIKLYQRLAAAPEGNQLAGRVFETVSWPRSQVMVSKTNDFVT
jgi:hypothetical protein